MAPTGGPVVRLALPLVLLAVLLACGALAAAAITEEEARRLFEELRCNTCHVEGGIASPWEEVLEEVGEEWPAEYATIDDAARDVEYMGQKMFRDFSHLMEVMGRNVGAPEDKLRQLEDFFRELFERGKAEAAEAKPAPEAARPGDRGAELAMVVVAAVAIAVIVAAAVYLATRRR